MRSDDSMLRASRRRFLQTSALGAAALPVALLDGKAAAAETADAPK